MRALLVSMASFGLLTTAPAIAAIDESDLPAGTAWYLHVDIEQMKSSAAGRQIYGWFYDEVLTDISDEVGIDVGEEVNRVTAFSADGDNYVAIVEGPLSENAQRKVLALTELRESLQTFEHRGKTYYYGSGRKARRGDKVERVPGYFSFALPGKMIASSSEDTLKELLDNNAAVAGAASGGSSVFILSADTQFVQAGMQTAQFADDGDDWNSNILRNTEEAALLVSDQGGMIAVEAKLVSKDPKLTQSLASIVGGVIALQAFNTELEPELLDIIRNTKVGADGNLLSLSTVLDPASVVRVLND